MMQRTKDSRGLVRWVHVPDPPPKPIITAPPGPKGGRGPKVAPAARMLRAGTHPGIEAIARDLGTTRDNLRTAAQMLVKRDPRHEDAQLVYAAALRPNMDGARTRLPSLDLAPVAALLRDGATMKEITNITGLTRTQVMDAARKRTKRDLDDEVASFVFATLRRPRGAAGHEEGCRCCRTTKTTR